MNITINTQTKYVTLLEDTSVTELIKFLQDTFDNWMEYKIYHTVINKVTTSSTPVWVYPSWYKPYSPWGTQIYCSSGTAPNTYNVNTTSLNSTR